MKIICLATLLLIATHSFSQQTTTKEAWLEKWENSKNYLLGIGEAMPEEHYDFKPTARQMTFKEQLVHIKGNMDWLSNAYFTAAGFERTKTKLPVTKAETIEILSKAFDATFKIVEATTEESLLESVVFFAGPKSKLQILNLLQDHVTHHRGQLIVYLNLKNVEPPAYMGW
jgi:uncharacterized damage-inducible protein DinB